MKIRRFQPQDTETATEIWNSIVEDGIAFPQINIIEGEEARLFFEGQSYAVVATNEIALHLYEKLGFTQLGRIPEGFLMKGGHYEDIIPHYIEL